MVIYNLLGVLAFAYNIVVELVPKGKCCKSWAWETCNGRQVQTPYRAVQQPTRAQEQGQDESVTIRNRWEPVRYLRHVEWTAQTLMVEAY